MTILVDADGVMENLTQIWVPYLNEKFGTHVAYEDVTEWDLTLAFPGHTREEVYGAELEEALYERMRPMPGAVEYMKKLIDDGHTIYVVTHTPYQIVPFKLEKVLFRLFPFLTWRNYILTTNKQMIRGDVLIDDGFHNLIGGSYHKLLFDAPYNTAFDAEANGMIRVHNWEEIYRVLQDLVPIDK